MNKELKLHLDYWSTWNIPRIPEIRETPDDAILRQLAQDSLKEIKRLEAKIRAMQAEKRRSAA